MSMLLPDPRLYPRVDPDNLLIRLAMALLTEREAGRALTRAEALKDAMAAQLAEGEDDPARRNRYLAMARQKTDAMRDLATRLQEYASLADPDRVLALRLQPASVSAIVRQRWFETALMLEGQGGMRTVDQFFAEIDQLSETADERAEEILGALYDWAEAIVPEH